MTVFAHSSGGFLAGKQVFPVDYEAEVSQRLVDACVSGDVKGALECVADPFVDVNFVGAVCLRSRRAEVVLREEAPDEVVVESEELMTDATPLFLAAHAGNVTLVRKLLVRTSLSLSLSRSLAPPLGFSLCLLVLSRLVYSYYVSRH